EDAIRRKARIEALLQARGIHTPASLPPVVSEVEVELRMTPEVAARCVALFACAVRAESLSAGNAISTAEIRRRLPRAFDALGPKERAFLAKNPPSEEDVTNHLWRYESLALLAWVLTWTPELPFPTHICDVPALARTMLDMGRDASVE